MAWLYATFKRDSVSLLRFPFHSLIKVFRCEILAVCRLFMDWNTHTVVVFPFLFPSFRCCIDTFVVCNDSGLSLFFLMESSNRRIVVWMLSSMLPSFLPHFFLDTYSLSTSSLRCKALCIFISFLVKVLPLSTSRIVPRILQEVGTALVFIPLIVWLFGFE